MRWLTRLVSRDIRTLRVLLEAERAGHRASIRRIGVLVAERDALKAKYEGVPS